MTLIIVISRARTQAVKHNSKPHHTTSNHTKINPKVDALVNETELLAVFETESLAVFVRSSQKLLQHLALSLIGQYTNFLVWCGVVWFLFMCNGPHWTADLYSVHKVLMFRSLLGCSPRGNNHKNFYSRTLLRLLGSPVPSWKRDLVRFRLRRVILWS